MDSFLTYLPTFIEVARNRSFSIAAANLGTFASTVSRRIALFEQQVGVPLLKRSTRSVELTEAGQTMLKWGLFTLESADSLREELIADQHGAAGTIRMAIHVDAYHELFRGVLSSFARQWPQIKFELTFCEQPINLLTEPFDLTVAMGPLADSSLKSRLLLAGSLRLYAAPSLLERCKTPQEPNDLRRLPCHGRHRSLPNWKLCRGREAVSITVHFAHVFASIAPVYEFTAAGLGVSLLARPMTAEAVARGELVQVLPEWTGPYKEVYLLMQSVQPRRVRLFIDYLTDAFADPLHWNQPGHRWRQLCDRSGTAPGPLPVADSGAAMLSE